MEEPFCILFINKALDFPLRLVSSSFDNKISNAIDYLDTDHFHIDT